MRRKRWIHAIGRDDVEKLKNPSLCSEHFEAGQFQRNLQNELLLPELGEKSCRELKEDAVPTLFTHKKTTQKRHNSDNRIENKERKKLVQNMLEMQEIEDDHALKPVDELLDKVEGGTQTYVYGLLADEIECVTEVGAFEFLNDSINTVFDNNDKLFSVDHDVDVDMSGSDGSEKEDEEEGSTPPNDNSAFVVFWSALFFLLSFSRNCASNAEVVNVIYIGTMITVKTRCASCGHQLIWQSQPIVNRFPIGNLMIVCGTILSGTAYARVSEIFQVLKVEYL